jgi:DNA-directed RNA polymerase specialized sigma subunit
VDDGSDFKRLLEALSSTVGQPVTDVKQKLEASRNAPYSQGMTEFLSAERATLIDSAEAAVSDLVERYEKLGDLAHLIARDIKNARAAVVRELHEDKSWGEVGELIGVSGSRAEQISRAAR